MPLQLRVIDPPTISDIVMRCVSDQFEIRDREGRAGRGFTNLKRILGRPADFAFVVDQLARTVPAGHAIVACDEGAWALGGAIAVKLGVPAVLVRWAPGPTLSPTEMTRQLVMVGWPASACRTALRW